MWQYYEKSQPLPAYSSKAGLQSAHFVYQRLRFIAVCTDKRAEGTRGICACAIFK
jgi:hypothetical protein